MSLPLQIRNVFERELESCDHAELIKSARELSDTYRGLSVRPGPGFSNRTQRLAYLVTRFPATFGAVESALTKIQTLNPQLRIASVLDLGAGAGSASWAAMEVFPGIERLTMVERDREMSAYAQKICDTRTNGISTELIVNAVERISSFDAHDLVIFSYSLGEIREDRRNAILDAAWNATQVLLIVIESGSTRGFSSVLSARSHLISKGALIAAPCPHANDCPLTAPDWCHFSARVQRSRLHREAKGGALAYEDEKFSFVAVSRGPLVASSARILRRPLARKGHIRLDLCTEAGIERLTVSKKNPEEFRLARHMECGDSWKTRSG